MLQCGSSRHSCRPSAWTTSSPWQCSSSSGQWAQSPRRGRSIVKAAIRPSVAQGSDRIESPRRPRDGSPTTTAARRRPHRYRGRRSAPRREPARRPTGDRIPAHRRPTARLLTCSGWIGIARCLRPGARTVHDPTVGEALGAAYDAEGEASLDEVGPRVHDRAVGPVEVQLVQQDEQSMLAQFLSPADVGAIHGVHL